MRLFGWLMAIAAAAAIPASAQSPTQLQPTKPTSAVLPAPAGPATGAPAATATSTGAPQLTKQDVDAWLDGYMPYALKAGGIPGAVVVVVKDGQPLTERGFGYSDLAAHKPVDPENTLFRPGSVSKLFTWTAVMQLVQAGKLNLDADISQYLDFKIPPRNGKPITLRNLMTHTPGFAETVKYLIVFGKNKPVPLRAALVRSIPDRIYDPGAMPAYSNYGASVAGYIVQRVSGERFEDYIQRHIFAPLGMNRSSFEQPLPANLDPLLSKAYRYGSDQPQKYEVIALSPAGALSSSGADMAKFMIAHLNNGGPLLNPATEQLMRSPANKPFPALPAMALGFYHEDRNGLNIVGHGGDTVFFHSDLHLFLDKNVGLFISMNSLGKAGAAQTLREELLQQFTDRYFPAPQPNLPTLASAKTDGQAISGHYVSSRAGAFSFLRMVALLGETKVAVDKDGNLMASSITDPSGQPRKWREIGHWLWQDTQGEDKLQAIANADGSVKMFSITPFAPIIEFLPAPASLNAGWILPLATIAIIILLISALGWPTAALVRRRFKAAGPYSGRPLELYRLTRIACWLFIALGIGWFIIISLLSSDLAKLDNGLDIWMRLLQLILVFAIVGTVVAIWNAWVVATAEGRRWYRTIWAILIALSAAFLVWLCIDLGLLTASLNY
ncbi:MAG TPA: serine hydrolase domain-containing protein [Sphingomicrobium sp.]|nr:serine hydrolase domain-containing protein [Sphingomicrobium sp.]